MALVQKKATAEAENAYGKPLTDYRDKEGNPLPRIIKYDYTWFEFDDDQSFIDAKEELSIARQRKVVNNNRKIKARQAANTAAMTAAGIEAPNAQNDSQVRLKAAFAGFYGKLISQGVDVEEARTKARARAAEFLEEKWDDDEDDDADETA